MMRVESDPVDGLDERDLATLVAAFYAKVRQDPLLAPIFNQAVEHWPAHLDRITTFWSVVILRKGAFDGNPLAAHVQHADALTPAHFDRWLRLWAETTSEHLSEAAAQKLQWRAAQIGESLQRALIDRPREKPEPGDFTRYVLKRRLT